VDTIRNVLIVGSERGVFRRGIDPVKLYISLASLAYHYISNQYTLKAAFQIDFTAESRRKDWLKHITEMILAFCQAQPSGPR